MEGEDEEDYEEQNEDEEEREEVDEEARRRTTSGAAVVLILPYRFEARFESRLTPLLFQFPLVGYRRRRNESSIPSLSAEYLP